VCGDEFAAHDAVVPPGRPREGFPVLLLDPVGQQERREAEAPEQGRDEDPAAAASPGDEAAVEAREADRETPPAHGRDGHAASQRKFFEQRRDEEQRHEERDGEVDDDDQREIGQIEPLLLGQQPDDAQRPDGGQQRSEDRDEDAPVAVVAVMVHHDDRRVDDDAQRHGDAGQRVDVDVQVQEVVEDRRHEDIDGQRRGDDGQVAQVAAHGEDEREQDGDAEQRAQVDLLQLARDVFRGVVGERGRQLGRETLLEARHLLLDRRGHPEHVRVRLAGDRQGDRVQSVDAEIARRPLLLPAGRGEVAQVVDAAVAFGDGNLPEVGCAPVAEAEDHGALRAVLPGQGRQPDDVVAEVGAESRGEVGGGDSRGLRRLGVEADDPFVGRDARQGDLPDAFDLGEGRRDVRRDELLDAFGREVGLDGIDERLGLLPVPRRRERNVGVADPFGELGVEVPDRGGDLEAGRRHVGSLGEGEPDAAGALRRGGGDARVSRDGRERPLDARGDVLFDEPRRGVGPGEVDPDAALGGGRRVLDAEHR